jgi:nucleotide-binding universal stress UspA family protein
MAVITKAEWSKPSTILFATEIPANEKALNFAVAQARDFGAHLILFHAYDTLVVSASEASGVRYYDYEAAARIEITHLEPLAQKVRDQGISCEIVVRPGLAADQILAYLRERPIDRVVMGTHAPGPLGKLLVGSVAEAVLRSAPVPVMTIGPDAVDGTFRRYETRTILCALRMIGTSPAVARFAVEVARQHKAKLILQHVVEPQERAHAEEKRTVEQGEAEMLHLVPEELRGDVQIEPIIVPGDATEELLYQSRAQQADLIILGAHAASALAAVTRQGVVYKVLAHAHCPVLTLSPVVLAQCGVAVEKQQPAEVFLAGIF